jgi:uncharacterized protein (DUF433 family)
MQRERLEEEDARHRRALRRCHWLEKEIARLQAIPASGRRVELRQLQGQLNYRQGTRDTVFDRISRDVKRMRGQACIRNLRLTVRRVIEALVLYPDRSRLRREYPELENDDIRQAVAYAARNLDA